MVAEGCFPLVTFLDADLVEISAEVDFAVIFGTADLVEGFFYMRQRMPVINSDVVECLVVNTDTGCRAWFSNNNQW